MNWSTKSSLLTLFIYFTGFFLLQAVCGTTVVPLCNSDGSLENCTTAMIKTNSSPRAVAARVGACVGEMEKFCWNGQCMYFIDLDEHYCRCDKGYTGTRCTHSELVHQPLSEEYLALTIFLTVMLLLAVAVAAFFAYKWYKNKKLRQPIKEYKEVNTQNI
ncbi:proepiregulin isoform X1 [Pelobates fuscus]|uniref:proepiregulin isoform X1 n=1 Tax=Pelobates fuscus TaxID=191477 RepID=UPI002FE49A7C